MHKFVFIGVALAGIHAAAFSGPLGGDMLYCAGDSAARDAAVVVDCSKPNQVVDALFEQVNWLAEKRVGYGIEALCSRPYNEALFAKENNPTSLSKLAPKLFNECNQALKSVKK